MSRLSTALVSVTALAFVTGGVITTSPVAEAAGPTIATLPTDNPANWSPNVLDGAVNSIWQVGDRVIVGGTFSQVADSTGNGGTVYSRTGLAAFDAATGLVDPNFAPVLNNDVEVVIPAADGTSVYIGGAFNTVDGVYRRKVARIDIATGALVASFDVNGVNGRVRDLRLVGNTLYVAGLFTSIGGQARSYLASLNADTGAVTDDLDLSILGQHNGGLTKVIKMDTTPAGDRLFVIGNFTSIDGQARDQAALIDISQSPATVSPWQTEFFESECHQLFDSYLRDVDIAEDGTFAVVTTTGAYRPDTSCDTISRLEIDTEVADVDPTWVSYTGGDTSYAVEVHDGVAYVGGHMRWVNNPFAGDRHGAGGVIREGMAALDVITGLPYSWDPGRDRGVGLFDFHVTEQGIWAGSDTDRWNNELRMKLAFFPWAGGSTVGLSDIGDLPNDIVQLGTTSGSVGTADPSVLYRVNAGGDALASVDDGPDWEADNSSSSPYRNSGSSIAGAPSNLPTPINHDSVPGSDDDRPPTQIWLQERWDGSGGSEMEWTFPVTAGTPIQVRLYFGNRCTCTDEVGERVFDIDLDGVNVIDDLDLTGQYGHDVGAMRAFDTISDGTVNIRFRHVVENPLVNAIEIIRTDVAAGGTYGQQDQVVRHTFDGVNAPTGTTVFAGQAPWKTVRGAFMADSTLFSFHTDGSIMRREVDGSMLLPGASIPTWANTIMNEMDDMTGIFYDPSTSQIYYTLAGDNNLYARDFVPESATISAARSTASGAIGALAPSRVNGMFLGLGHLWFADASTGDLYKMPYAGGTVSGTPVVADSSIDWRGRALFRATNAQPNVVPTADFSVECTDNSCAFDGTDSTDSDGTIVSYDWDFGDGTTGSGSEIEHAYGAAGTYSVTLTVTDDRGGTDQHSDDVSVSDPPNVAPVATFTMNCAALECSFDGLSSADSDGSIVSYAWDFGDGTGSSAATDTHTYAAAGTYQVSLTVIDDDGASGTDDAELQVFDSSVSVGFRAAADDYANTQTPQITVPAEVEAGDQLVYIVTANRSTSITTPAGWTLLGTEQDGGPDMTSWVFTRTADGNDAGSTVTVTLGARSKTAGVLTAYQNATPPTEAIASVITSSSVLLTTPATSVPYDGSAVVSYWSDKTSGNSGWTVPGTVVERAAAVGSGGGRVTAAIADTFIGAGSWPGATASSTSSGSKGIGWTIVLAPSTGNLAPTATLTSSCTLLTCSFDGMASVDPDGTIVSYDWDFGDGNTATGPTANHTYAASGAYTVTLTVTDDDAASASDAQPVIANLAIVEFRDGNSVNVTTSSPSVQVPGAVQPGDQLVLFAATNKAVDAQTPAGWTALGSAEDGQPDLRTWVFTRTADATDAGASVQVSLSTSAKTSLVLLAYEGGGAVTVANSNVATSNSTDLATPSATIATEGSVVISYWVDKTGGNTGWTLPGSVIPREASAGSGGGRITAAAGDSGAAVGTWPGATATGTVNGGKAIGWTVVVPAP